VEWTAVRHKLNDYDGVLERLSRAVELARVSGDKERLATALSWTANIHLVTGYPSRGIPYLMETQELAAALGNEQLSCAPMFMASISLADRDPRAGAEKLKDVVEIARKHRMLDLEGHAMAFRAVALARLGDFSEARAELERACAIEPKLSSPIEKADIHISASL